MYIKMFNWISLIANNYTVSFVFKYLTTTAARRALRAGQRCIAPPDYQGDALPLVVLSNSETMPFTPCIV
jgi:hypothetical protein